MAMTKVFSVTSADEAPGIGFPLLTALHYKRGRATAPFLKSASVRRYISKDVRGFIETLKYADHPDRVHVLVSAQGASERWGANRRGDDWPEVEINPPSGTDAYGWRTYPKFGHAFLHHNNKSPDLAVGKVVFASWNPGMRRIEIVKYIKRSDAPEVCARIDRGEMISTSMGTRVPYDVCTYCGNQAKTADQHCADIKEHIGEVLRNGLKIAMRNIRPVYFDSSCVRIPAGEESGVILPLNENTKIAHDESSRLGIELFGDPKRSDDKDSSIIKEVDATVEPIDTSKVKDPDSFRDRADVAAEVLDLEPHVKDFLNVEPTLPESILRAASDRPMIRTASTFASMGIQMRPEEFQYIFLSKAGYGKQASELYSQRILLHVDSMPEVGSSMKVSADHFDEEFARSLVPHLPSRSVWEPHLTSRIEGLARLPSYKIAEYENPVRAIPQGNGKGSSPTELLLAMALGYGVYRKMAPPEEMLSAMEQVLKRHPWLAPAVFLAGAWGVKGLTDAISQPREGVKVGGVVWHYIAPVAGSYLLAASAMRKEREGYPLGTIEKLVRHYPLPAGIAGVIGARKLTRPLAKIRKSLRAATLPKAAGAVRDAAVATALGWYSPYRFPMALADFVALEKIFGPTKATPTGSVVGSVTEATGHRVSR